MGGKRNYFQKALKKELFKTSSEKGSNLNFLNFGTNSYLLFSKKANEIPFPLILFSLLEIVGRLRRGI